MSATTRAVENVSPEAEIYDNIVRTAAAEIIHQTYSVDRFSLELNFAFLLISRKTNVCFLMVKLF
jgi:hypothetical protein